MQLGSHASLPPSPPPPAPPLMLPTETKATEPASCSFQRSQRLTALPAPAPPSCQPSVCVCVCVCVCVLCTLRAAWERRLRVRIHYSAAACSQIKPCPASDVFSQLLEQRLRPASQQGSAAPC